MAAGPPERDWKIFRELREVALDRLCERALQDAQEVLESSEKTHHERLIELNDLIAERNQQIARSFDAPRRSTMILQLLSMTTLGLLEADELARFSAETRQAVEPRDSR